MFICIHGMYVKHEISYLELFSVNKLFCDINHSVILWNYVRFIVSCNAITGGSINEMVKGTYLLSQYCEVVGLFLHGQGEGT